VENYFNYFTEIEECFQRRRGGILLLSTLDWALIETWKDAGIPLQAALRGIEAAFDRYEKRPTKRKVNSLTYCAQEVLATAEEMKEAAVGGAAADEKGQQKGRPAGFDSAEIAQFLIRNAEQLDRAVLPQGKGISGEALARETAATLRAIAKDLEDAKTLPRLEDLERRLTVMEENCLRCCWRQRRMTRSSRCAPKRIMPWLRTGERCRRRRLINCSNSMYRSGYWKSMDCRG